MGLEGEIWEKYRDTRRRYSPGCIGFCDSVHELENKIVFTSPVSPLPTCSILKFIPKSLVIYMDFKLFLATFQSSGHWTHLKEPHNH